MSAAVAAAAAFLTSFWRGMEAGVTPDSTRRRFEAGEAKAARLPSSPTAVTLTTSNITRKG